ncbi:MAG: hypothetical protein A2X67_01835 [Ignavibacteria bacterium GWA2_55_11]|nr:MAG: hypothetical protein A2X67_01835 [Ignavibacteria bacterium GWA2_55_11]OGU63951.1 MAG: hypothetical protein A3C56_13380 [Ignavibacteria bacterium RIFCSPHIGHO2_02_FULL_56_12]OGU70086.1 MAG: hypothetical protein A3H45_09690 [Ignavibacteria bacterium RIFCSPLOWO2_02_FULL_55_14]OGU75719.1 MAG: hypothetical protein A3G43_04325 [Ignavibacteria bacterium RIFCSPLOWO2_12_FULL_56_21]
MGSLLSAYRVRHEGQEGQVTRTLDRHRQLTLVLCACAGDPARNDPSLLGNRAGQTLLVLVIDVDVLGVAKTTRAFLALLLVTAAAAAAGSAPRTSTIGPEIRC